MRYVVVVTVFPEFPPPPEQGKVAFAVSMVHFQVHLTGSLAEKMISIEVAMVEERRSGRKRRRPHERRTGKDDRVNPEMRREERRKENQACHSPEKRTKERRSSKNQRAASDRRRGVDRRILEDRRS